jgi:hypothetical protein
MAEAAQVRDVQLSTPSLIKLIKMDLTAGEQAGLEYYERAGARLLELKGRPEAKNWRAFVRKHFGLSKDQLWRYMKLAKSAGSLKDTRRAGETLSEAIGDYRPHHDSDAVRQARAQYAAEREQRAQASAYYTSTSQRDARRTEYRGIKERAEEIINLGYRLAASKYHPDKQGGSHAEMTRTIKARDQLRNALRRLL